MKQVAALILLLVISTFAAAQTAQTAPSSSNAPATQTPQVLVTTPGGLSTNTGTAVIIAPPSAPLVVTPEFHLAPIVTATGATNATPGNTAGAVNATAAMPVAPRVITTVPEFSTAAGTVFQTVPAQGMTGASTAAPGTAGATGAPVVIVNNSVLLDRGVGSGSTLVAGSDTGGKSLGEIARENRQREAGLNAHVYSNQDIERINTQSGVQVGGMTGAAIGAGTATGTQRQQQQPSNMPAVAQPSANPPQNPGVSQPVPPSNNPPDQSMASPSNPLGRLPGQREMAQANPPANPADQNAPTPSARTQYRGGNQLPSGSSILPLVAVVGVLAAGAGLLSR